MADLIPSDLDRLMSRIEYDTNGGCWLSNYSLTSAGYAQVVIRQQHELVHRASWILHYGLIPDGLFILHKCDVRPCFRPDHLFPGTAEDNIYDCLAKDRHRCISKPGALNPAAVLSEEAVRVIRASTGRTQISLGAEFGVSQTTISDILLRKTWQ